MMFLVLLVGVLAKPLISQKTVLNEDKSAYVVASEGMVTIDKFELHKGEEAIISFDKNSTEEYYDICFRGFEGYWDNITINSLKKDVSLWFDDNLLTNTETINNITCFTSFKADKKTKLKFNAEYNGDGRIKFDVLILPARYNKNFTEAEENNNLIILDPYLIGNLAITPRLLFYLPFNGNISDVAPGLTFTDTDNTEINDTCGVSFEEHYTMTVTNPNIISYYKASVARDVAPNIEYFVEFNYIDGSSINTSVQAVTSVVYTSFYFSNPNESNAVSSVTSWCKGNGVTEFAEKNRVVFWNITYNTSTRYYLNGSSGYDYALIQNIADIWGGQDGIKTRGGGFTSEGLIFDGDNDYVTIGTNTDFNAICNDGCTFVVDFKAAKLHDGTLIARYDTTNDNRFFRFRVRSSGNFEADIYEDGTTASSSIKEVAGYTPGVMTEVVAVFNGSTSTGGVMCIWKNGENLGCGVSTTTIDNTAWQSNEDTFIGVLDDGAFINDFNGTISRLLIYNRTLPDEEIIKLFLNGTYGNNTLNETNTTIFFNSTREDYVKTNQISFINSTSFWYKNLTGNWTSVINNSNTYYINGVVGAVPSDYPLFVSNNRITIGMIDSTTFFDGHVDELLVYNYLLSSIDIETLVQGYSNLTKLGICNGSPDLLFQVLDFIFFDEITNVQINASLGITLTGNDGTDIFNVTGFEEDKETVSICTNRDPNEGIFNFQLFGALTASSPTYVTRIFEIIESDNFIVNNENITTFPLYLIQTDNSSTITYTWLTRQFQSVDGIMRLSQCNLDGTKTLIESVSIISGEAVANIELFVQPYSYTVVIDGTTYSNLDSFTRCHTESSTERTYFVDVLNVTDVTSVTGLLFVDCQLSNVNNTVSMVWEDNINNDDAITGCIQAYRQTIYNASLFYENCTNQSNTLVRVVPDDGTTITIRGKLSQDGVTGYCEDEVVLNQPTNAGDRFGQEAVLAVVILILSLAFIWAAEHPTLKIVAAIIGLVVTFFLGITYLSWYTISTMIIYLAIILLVGRYSKK